MTIASAAPRPRRPLCTASENPRSGGHHGPNCTLSARISAVGNADAGVPDAILRIQIRARNRQSPASTTQTGVIRYRSGLLREMPFMMMPTVK